MTKKFPIIKLVKCKSKKKKIYGIDLTRKIWEKKKI